MTVSPRIYTGLAWAASLSLAAIVMEAANRLLSLVVWWMAALVLEVT